MQARRHAAIIFWSLFANISIGMYSVNTIVITLFTLRVQWEFCHDIKFRACFLCGICDCVRAGNYEIVYKYTHLSNDNSKKQYQKMAKIFTTASKQEQDLRYHTIKNSQTIIEEETIYESSKINSNQDDVDILYANPSQFKSHTCTKNGGLTSEWSEMRRDIRRMESTWLSFCMRHPLSNSYNWKSDL